MQTYIWLTFIECWVSAENHNGIFFSFKKVAHFTSPRRCLISFWQPTKVYVTGLETMASSAKRGSQVLNHNNSHHRHHRGGQWDWGRMWCEYRHLIRARMLKPFLLWFLMILQCLYLTNTNRPLRKCFPWMACFSEKESCYQDQCA